MEIRGQRSLRAIKLVISLGFYLVSCIGEVIQRLRGKAAKAKCVILYYHAVSSVQRIRFARQMDALIRWTKPIRVDIAAPLGRGIRYAAVTFDDGFESVIENALPELEKRNIPATIFVLADFLGRCPGWDGWPERVMSVDQLRKLPAHLVHIGSHTMTHPVLPSINEDQAKHELSKSRAKLEGILKRKVILFSFPYGAFNEKLIDWCREAGYERVFTTLPVLAFTHSNEFVTGRVWADPADWKLEFYLKLCGAYRWLPFAFALKRKGLTSAIMRRWREHMTPRVQHRAPS